MRWCIEQRQLPPLAVEPAELEGVPGVQRCGFVAARDAAAGDVLLQIPGSLAITAVDVAKDPQLEPLAQGRSELVGLALWLMQERSKVGGLRSGSAANDAGPCNTCLHLGCRGRPQSGARCWRRCLRPR